MNPSLLRAQIYSSVCSQIKSCWYLSESESIRSVLFKTEPYYLSVPSSIIYHNHAHFHLRTSFFMHNEQHCWHKKIKKKSFHILSNFPMYLKPNIIASKTQKIWKSADTRKRWMAKCILHRTYALCWTPGI